ncbi:MAG: helix-turn-helix domain-containing protein [Proteobacteria bacterium]|nr:helix-turn-helix domain-containing protein [Pseudomonadota bacterium]
MGSSKTDNVVSIKSRQVSCKDCRLRKFCLAADLNVKELGMFEGITQHRRSLERGARVFHIGDRFNTLYTVRTGSLKTYTLTPDGREKIIGFYLPGDLIGLDAMGSGIHGSSAEVLETTTLCAIPFNRMSSIQSKSLQQRLLNLASEQIQTRDRHITLLGKERADQRLASFLVHLADRFKALGYSAKQFNLSMSRADIGNYLNLAIETVSRVFAKLRSSGLINVDRRQLRINNLEKLRCLAAAEIPKDIRIIWPGTNLNRHSQY